jgi:rhamnogalacturonyl hydrolase YesR|tara:strand:- start:1090 stop:1278 length:189 start_codon:yes stop_codon:yes gene_type:complete
MTKEKATLEMIIRWLNSNIDEGGFENNEAKDLLAVDSRDLKEKIELALDPQTTVEQIENGDL